MNSEIITHKKKPKNINKLEKKESLKAIRIHQLLLSFIKKEIKEKKKNINIFFSSYIGKEKESNKKLSRIPNNYDHNSGETFENSDFEESLSNEDSSSDMSCEEELSL